MNNALQRYKQTADRIRQEINSKPLTSFYRLERSNKGSYICPICGSGTGKHKTGALSIRKQDNRVTCFASGCFGDKGEDTLGALRKLYPAKTEKDIFAMCGYALDQDPADQAQPAAASTPEKRRDPQPLPDFAEEISRYAAALPGSPAESYLKARGLTAETMQRFKLGYMVNARGEDVVTIPYNTQGSYYGMRIINSSSGRAHDNLKGGRVPLYNPAAMYAGSVCFIVESPICAISIEQAGYHACALAGTGHINNLIDQIKQRTPSAALIICMDNDDAGRKARDKIDSGMQGLHVFYCDGTAAIMGDAQDAQDASYHKDPNEVLQAEGAEELQKRLRETSAEVLKAAEAQRKTEDIERAQRIGQTALNQFFETITSRKYEPIPTGIIALDSAIGGGLMRQQLILLGAAPGAGKTALSQWVFEGMAARGHDVVYLNLEMGRDQMIARSISRIAARHGHQINATTILQGYKWTADQRAAITAAIEEYGATIAPGMIYNPDNVSCDLDSIMKYLDAEAIRAEQAARPAPIVVLDYLQIITGDMREDEKNLIKRAVSAFKGFAIKHNTITFAIIATNRATNKTGIISMESGRDTSALEYSADLLLGLTFTGCLDRGEIKGKSPDDLRPDERQNITLRVLKGRFGGAGTDIDLHFEGQTMTFTQQDGDFTRVDTDTPWDAQPKKQY